MKRTRTDDASIEQRVREIINPAFDEWIGRKIDAAELDRRRELAHKQATAEYSGSPTAVASWATAATETGVKSAAEARCAAIGPRRRMCRVHKCLHPRSRCWPALPLACSISPHQAAGSNGVGLGTCQGWNPKRPSESSCHLASNSLSSSHCWFIRAALPSVAVTTARLFLLRAHGVPNHTGAQVRPPKSLRRCLAARHRTPSRCPLPL